MSKSFETILPELVMSGIISKETSLEISDYLAKKPETQSNRLFTIFGILGALLVGLGVILIIAHNWDVLGRQAKTTISFLPLISGASSQTSASSSSSNCLLYRSL